MDDVEATTNDLLANAQAGTLTNSDMHTARELLADNSLDFRRGDKLAIAALIAISQGGYTEARLYTLRHDDRAQQQAVYARAESRISDYLNRLGRV